jgi:uncharacterized protein (DUF885 family)
MIRNKRGKYIICFICTTIVVVSICAVAGKAVYTSINRKAKSVANNDEVNYKTPPTIEKFYDECFRVTMDRDPEGSTYLGNLKEYGVISQNNKLTDLSEKHQKQTADLNKRFLNDIRSYKKEEETESQKLNSDIIEWYYEDLVKGEKFNHHNYIVNQFNGVQSDLIDFMISYQNIENIQDANNYIARLSEFDTKLKSVIEQVNIRSEMGVIPPKIIIEKVLEQIMSFTAPKSTENELYTSFSDKVAEAKVIKKNEQEKLCKEVDKQIKDKVYPSYKKLYDVMEKLQAKAPEEVGVWKLPNGDEYYAYLLRQHTTTDLTPEEVHNLGLKEVNRIQAEMRKSFKDIGYEGTDISEGLHMAYTSGFIGQDTMDQIKVYLSEVEKKIPQMFDIRPKAKLDLQAVPKFKENSFPNAYMPASLDGSRKGAFLVNLSMMGCKETLKPLSYHEGIPGHHFQLALQSEMKEIPVLRNNIFFTSYVEGWALYAETLANECGLYDNANTKIGYLQSQLYRAGRMVVDTGIHYKKWTRDQAAEYMRVNCGFNNSAEIDRYIAYPGQACAYMVGELKILELREKAKKELGSEFDIKEFHNVILRNGSMPLELLEKEVQKYIDSKK